MFVFFNFGIMYKKLFFAVETFFSVFERGHIEMVAKNSGKIAAVGKSAFISDVGNAVPCFFKQTSCGQQSVQIEIIVESKSRQFLKNFRKMTFAEPGDGGGFVKSYFLRKIYVQIFKKSIYCAFILRRS